ncbi:MAG: ABC transporter permease [Methanothrix sp.]|nr:MAG: ABC transporter permease [Methanothrix sp.]
MNNTISHLVEKCLPSASVLKKSPTAIVGIVIILTVAILAAFAPWVSPYGPTDTNLYSRMEPPSTKHLLGTDNFGRDLLSRIICGSRVSLQVGIISVAIGMISGVAFGLMAGYSGGILEVLIMRFMDLLLSFPGILLAIAVVATIGPGLVQVMIAVGIASIPGFARVTHGKVLSIKQMDYVEAARGLGASGAGIMVRHILPNALTPIIVLATLNIAGAIIMEAALSFLGIGVQPPSPTWGIILSDGRRSMQTAPWISTFSGLAIMFTVLGFNLFGDGLRDIMDPKTSRVIQRKSK